MKTVTNKYILLYNSIYSTQWYVVMWHQTLYFAESGDTTSAVLL